jgi:hypothetical protein
MANQNILSRSRTRVKKKFLISFFVLGLALSSAFITFDDYQLNLVLAFAFSVIIIHIEKMPRYWRANRSNDIEVIENGLSWSHANKQTTLPFSIPGVFIVVILVVYLVYSIIEARIDKALLGLSVLVSLVNNRQKEIMFDYDNAFYYGLWKAESFYDSDRQPMKSVRFNYYESEAGVEKIRITDKSGYYDIYKRNFLDHTWNRIVINLERITDLNVRSEAQN